jgi:hypothetical protein
LTYGKHNDRLAQDLIISKDGKQLKGEELRSIGEKWESLGGRWGGRFGLKLVVLLSVHRVRTNRFGSAK